MRQDVHDIEFDEMSAELRRMVAFESNGVLNLQHPQPIFEQVLRETPVVRWERGVGFFRMEDVVAAARNPDMVAIDPETCEAFGMGSAAPLIPLNLDGDVHRLYRKLLDPLFTPRKMALLEFQIRELANQLIDGFIAHGQADLHDTLCVPLPSTVFLTLFGMPLEDSEFLISKKDRILNNEGTTMMESEEIGRAAGRELDAHLRMRLAERRAETERRADLLDAFLSFEIDGRPLTDDEIVNLMHMFMIAGLDTVTSSLSCILAWLATHPDERRQLVGHPEQLAPAIEEIMRVECPVPSALRWAALDTEVNGVPVKRGDMVFLSWASANLDQGIFDNPMSVDLTRDHNPHLAYAAGFHRCLGSHLARAELRTALDQFHKRIPDYSVTPGDAIEYECIGIRHAKHLPVSWSQSGAES